MGDGALGRARWLLVIGSTVIGAAWLAPAAQATQCAPGYSNPSTPLGPDQSVCQLTLSSTGAPQTVTIPAGVDSVTIRAAGGAGGISQTTTPGNDCGREGSGHGEGLVAQGGLAVTPGEQLNAVVGDDGQAGTEDTGGAGGYGGGGTGAPNTSDYADADNGCGAGGSGGGGGSFVYGPDGALLVAAGGGGGGSFPNLTASAENGGNATSGSGGAAATGPGAAGAGKGRGPAGELGTFGEGGGGGAGCFFGGGGGGGGYYGGGGSGGGGDSPSTDQTCAAGNPVGGGFAGAGSNYFSPVLSAPQTIATGFSNNGPIYLHGYVFISYSALVVNSTALTSDDPTNLANGMCNTTPSAATPTCTLPAAIEVADKQTGETIDFDIPSEVDGVKNTFDGSIPQIQDPTGQAIPSITSPVTIDGATQPDGGYVEISGTANDPKVGGSYSRGLWVGIGGAGSRIEGMVINGYNDQVFLQGGNDTITHDRLGTDAAGTGNESNPLRTNSAKAVLAQVGVDLASSGNEIGGPGTGQGNVIASGWFTPADEPHSLTRDAAAIEEDAAETGNVIESDSLGVAPGTDDALTGPAPAPVVNVQFAPEPGVSLVGRDTVGGGTAGAGNRSLGARISGPSVLQGNTFFGTVTVTGNATLGGPAATPGAAPGNTFSPPQAAFVNAELIVTSGARPTVQGNELTGDTYGAIELSGDHATIGGEVRDLGNTIEHSGGGHHAAVTINGNDNLIEHNTFEHNNAVGGDIGVETGDGNTITRNVMTDDSWGITLGSHGYVYEPEMAVNPRFPNDSEIYPILGATSSTRSGTAVELTLEQRGTVTVDLYSEKSCELQASSPGLGEDYLGSKTVSSSLGTQFVTLTFAPMPAGQDAITATATGSDGSTSEFSPCLNRNSASPSLVGTGVAPTLPTVDVTGPGNPAADLATPLATVAGAARVGHGQITLLCPARTTRFCAGGFTLTTTGRHPTRIAHKSFKMRPGLAAGIAITVPASLFKRLMRAHRLTAIATTVAHDGAKRPHHKTRRVRLTLVYAPG